MLQEKRLNMKNYLITYEWNGKLFTSQDRLNTLFMKGYLLCNKKPTTYGAYYTFLSLAGEEIATFYKDSHFGFGSQATGIELKNAIPVIETF